MPDIRVVALNLLERIGLPGQHPSEKHSAIQRHRMGMVQGLSRPPTSPSLRSLCAYALCSLRLETVLLQQAEQ